MPQHGSRRTARDLALLIGLTLALHVPFIGQAFHLDDVQYLDIAQNVYKNPLFPLDMELVFDGRHMDMWGYTHPPLNSYVIAGALLLNNREPSETFLHTVFLIFPVLAAVSFYFLARQFVNHAFLAAMLLATNPTLMVCAHTLMADVPLLSLWLCGVGMFVRGVDRNQNAWVYASALAITAASFYAYQGLAIIPLLAFHALRRKRFGQPEIVAITAPVLLLGGWQYSGYLHRGMTYISTMFGYLQERGITEEATKIRTAIAAVTYLGGTIIPFPFIFCGIGRRWKGALTWMSLGLAVVLVHQKFAAYSWMEKAFLAACFGAGTVIILWVIVRGLESWSARNWTTDEVFLGLWFIGMLAVSVVAFFSGSARYLLPALPPLLLLLMSADDQRIGLQRSRFFCGSLIGIQILLGICLAHSDYEFAETGRQEAREFKSLYLSNGEPFYFSGEWGLRYYLTSMGGEIVALDTTGAPGRLMVKSRLCMGRIFDNAVGRSLETLEVRTYRIRSPFRLLDEHSRAGFWSDGWGVLPFSFSREALDEFSIYRLK